MDTHQAIAIILGSETFPHLPSGFSKKAFSLSAERFVAYLQTPAKGLGLTQDRVLNLFNNEDNVDRQDARVGEFIERWKIDTDMIFIYYVGHGGFLSDRQHFLFIKNTDPKRKHMTGWRSKDLAETLKLSVGNKKIFLILDCCFAGAFIDNFQNDEVGHIVENQTYDNFPASGVALLAASSRNEPAITLDGGHFTMFNEALMSILSCGIENCGNKMSLRNIAEATAKSIRDQHGLVAVRPEIHTPRQLNDDIADLGIFPNNSPPMKRKNLSNEILEEKYFSEMETDFQSWQTFHPTLPPGQVHTQTAKAEVIDGVRVLKFETARKWSLGSNKTIDAACGVVYFNYKISEPFFNNVVFYVIPMETGNFVTPARRTPNHEIWRSDKRASRNPLRAVLQPKRGDVGKWVDAELRFDFRHLKEKNSIFAMFAPRLNEGVSERGSGCLLISKVRIFRIKIASAAG